MIDRSDIIWLGIAAGVGDIIPEQKNGRAGGMSEAMSLAVNTNCSNRKQHV